MNSDVELKPCPFCAGGETTFNNLTHGSDKVLTVRLVHHCGPDDWPCVEFSAPTKAEAIEAWNRRPSLDQAEGFVLVPQSALDWLMGSGVDAHGKWFGEVEEATPTMKALHDRRPAFWWRSHFRKLIEASSPSPDNAGGWRPIETAPHACHVMAARWDECEWVYGVVMSPPGKPWTHWRHLPVPPSYQYPMPDDGMLETILPGPIVPMEAPPTPEAPSTNLEHKETAEETYLEREAIAVWEYSQAKALATALEQQLGSGEVVAWQYRFTVVDQWTADNISADAPPAGDLVSKGVVRPLFAAPPRTYEDGVRDAVSFLQHSAGLNGVWGDRAIEALLQTPEPNK